MRPRSTVKPLYQETPGSKVRNGYRVVAGRHELRTLPDLDGDRQPNGRRDDYPSYARARHWCERVNAGGASRERALRNEERWTDDTS